MEKQRKKFWKIFAIGFLIFLLVLGGHFAYREKVIADKGKKIDCVDIFYQCPDFPKTDKEKCEREMSEYRMKEQKKCARDSVSCSFLFYCD